MVNKKYLDSNILPFTNVASIAAIVANYQPIRRDVLILASMLTKQVHHKRRGEGEENRIEVNIGKRGGYGHIGY